VCTIRVGKMSYGLNKSLQMCTVKIESGTWLQIFPSPSPAKMDLSPISSPSPDSITTILAFSQQKHNKACVPDGIHVVAYVFVCHRLYVYISLLLSLCVRYGYLPNDFMTTFISTLAKCASGDLTDVHNMQFRCQILYQRY